MEEFHKGSLSGCLIGQHVGQLMPDVFHQPGLGHMLPDEVGDCGDICRDRSTDMIRLGQLRGPLPLSSARSSEAHCLHTTAGPDTEVIPQVHLWPEGPWGRGLGLIHLCITKARHSLGPQCTVGRWRWLAEWLYEVESLVSIAKKLGFLSMENLTKGALRGSSSFS